eukprot:COSAG02_NODE_67000_length_254_cov_0.651613_1_plen_24_part_01
MTVERPTTMIMYSIHLTTRMYKDG